MSLLLDQIHAWLTSQGIVDGSTGWGCSEGFLPPSPDKMVAVYETIGDAPDVIRAGEPTAMAYDYPGFQVRVRSSEWDYVGARNKIEDVFKGLHQNEPVITSGEPFIYIECANSSPLPMGLDAENRPSLVLNFKTMRQR